MVRPRRLELPCLAALPPQGSASTNFATVAQKGTYDKCKHPNFAMLIAILMSLGKDKVFAVWAGELKDASVSV